MSEEKSLAGWDKRIGVSRLEIDSIAKKIMSLSLEDIDKLWLDSGWIDEEAKKDKRKALPNWRLKKIKENQDFAEESFIMLIQDEPYYELRTAAHFIQNLNKLSGKNK